jgi:ATP-dependent DNA helicase RecQ
MRFLREQLDDPGSSDCGRCDNCGSLALDATTSQDELHNADTVLRRPGVAIDARRQWPAAMAGLGVAVSGRIAASQQAEQGRAVARYTDLGYGPRVRAALALDADDGPVADDLVTAAVAVLREWHWPERPAAVVHVGSARRTRLVSDFAARISEIGRLPDLGAAEHLGPSSSGLSNSAQRLRGVWDAYVLGERITSAVGDRYRGEPLLLIDDYTDTGWTLTVVARMLRMAGAGAVYPFVLGLAA